MKTSAAVSDRPRSTRRWLLFPAVLALLEATGCARLQNPFAHSGPGGPDAVFVVMFLVLIGGSLICRRSFLARRKSAQDAAPLAPENDRRDP